MYATEKIAHLKYFLNVNGWEGKHYKTENNLAIGTNICEVYFEDWKYQDSWHLFIIS